MSPNLFSRSAFHFAWDGTPFLVLDDVTIELPGGSPFAFAHGPAVEEAPASGLGPVAAIQAPEAVEPAPPAIEPAPVTVAEAVPPAAPEPPPVQSQAELDLYAQYAHLADGFNGDQALADLIASDWAAQNDWHGAGGTPLG